MNLLKSQLRLVFLSAAAASCSNQGAGQLLVKKKTTEPTTVTETVYVDRRTPETSTPSQRADNETDTDEPSSSTEVGMDESSGPRTKLATIVQLAQQAEENLGGSTQLQCVIVSDLSFDARFERVVWRWFRDTAIVPGWTSDTVQVPRDMIQKTFSCAARLLNDSDPSRSSPWSQPSAPWDGRAWFQSLGTDRLTGGNSAGVTSPEPEAQAGATPSPEPLQGPDSEVISDQSPPTSSAVLTCRRAQHHVSLSPGQTEVFRWFINNSEATGLSSATLSAPHLTPGTSISCSTRLSHPTDTSLASQWGMPAAPVVIATTAPPLPLGPAAEISPSDTTVYPTATLTCSRPAPADALSPGQSEEFRWYRNGTLETEATGASVSGSLLSVGSSLTCSIRLVHASDAGLLTQWGSQSNPVTVQPIPGPSVTLTASSSPPTVESTLSCALDDTPTDPNISVEWQWHKDSLVLAGVSSASLSIFDLEKDATFNCSARLVWSGGVTLSSLWGASSASLLIRNSTPALPAPTVTPDEDVTLDTVLTCNSGTPTDPDAADAANLTIEKDWLRNGVSLALASDTLDLGSLSPLSIGDSLTYRTRVTDGTDTSAFNSAPAVSITNRAPSVADPADSAVNEGTEAALSLPLTDADGDALSYACVSGCPAGVAFSGAAPQVRWTPGYADAGVYTMTLRVSDGTATQDFDWQLTVNAVTDASLALIGSSDFGIVHHDGTSPLTLTLQNSGVAPATDVTLSSLNTPFSFGAGSTCNTSSTFVLAGGTSCTIELEFIPAHISSFTETLGVSYHNSDTIVSFDRTVDAQVRLVVEPVYPANGSRWTDWVRYQDEGFSFVEQLGNSCRGVTEDEENACIHAGEMRKVVVPGESSCAGLTISDTLGQFSWGCSVMSGKATFFSVFTQNSSFRSLIDLTATPPRFKSATVTVQKGGLPLDTSVPAAWWEDAEHDFIELPDNSLPTDPVEVLSPTAGKVTVYYFRDANRLTSGYRLSDDSAHVVVIGPEQYQLMHNGSTENGCSNSAAVMEQCVIGQVNGNYNWYEINLHGQGAVQGLYLVSKGAGKASTFNSVRRSMFSSTTHALQLEASATSQGIKLNNITANWATSSNGYGLYLQNARLNRIHGFRSNLSLQFGLLLNNARDNVFNDIIVTNVVSAGGDGTGIGIAGTSQRNRFVRLLLGASGNAGIKVLDGADANVFQNVTITHSGSDLGLTGAITVYSDRNQFSNITITGMGHPTNTSPMGAGIFLVGGSDCSAGITSSADNNIFHNTSVSHATIGVYDCATDNNTFSGGLILQNNFVGCANGPTSGISAVTCSTTTPFSSAANRAATPAFVGKTADTNHPAASGGLYASSTSITSWHSFQRPSRIWGKNGTGPADVTNRGSCYGTACQIYDLALTSADTAVRNMTHAAPAWTGNGAFTPGATCPDALHGDAAGLAETMYSQNLVTQAYLLHATEVVGDYSGNEDGICNSNEVCLYAPNYGYYQGHGSTGGACTFVDGTTSGVSGASVYAYPSNGY